MKCYFHTALYLQLKIIVSLSYPCVALSPGWEGWWREAGSKERVAACLGAGEQGTGGGIAAAASRDNVPFPVPERLAKPPNNSLLCLFPELGIFIGYTTVVSVIWRLSSALRETCIKEIQYIYSLLCISLIDRQKEECFLSCALFLHPFSFVSRC